MQCRTVPRQPCRPDALIRAVFRGSAAISDGLLTRHSLRSKAWRRLFHDVYADSVLPVDHALRCRGAALLLPPQAALVGLSAAWWHGVYLAQPQDPVEVAIGNPHAFGPVRGIRLYTVDIDEYDIAPGSQPRITTLSRAAIHIARHYDTEAALTALAAIVATKKCTVDSLFSLLPRDRPRPWGYARAERTLHLLREL